MTDGEWDRFMDELRSWKETLAVADAQEPGADVPSVSAISLERKRDPWSVLVSTILSLRTKDEVTLVTSRRLLEHAPSPAALLALGEAAIGELAYPAGFYKTKAKQLLAIARILEENYDGRVPDRQEALLALPGVGLKTANLVLAEAFDVDAICVDTHVHRIANRMGWVATPTADKTEAALRAALPRRHWKEINPLLVLYGQRVCTPTSPRCSICAFVDRCARQGVSRSR